MSGDLERFQSLLQALFRSDARDEDMGFTRILNLKRTELDKFVTARLPGIVDTAFVSYSKESLVKANEALVEARREVTAAFGSEAVDPAGTLAAEFRDTPLGKRYQAARASAEEARVPEELKSRTYNDLYAFFARYFVDGDLIAKRRYGRNERYAIPYDGEEVFFYWVNNDQYYVKTTATYRSYRFTARDLSVAFELSDQVTTEEPVENPYVVYLPNPGARVDADARRLTVSFERRGLNADEQATYGRTAQQRPQARLNTQAAEEILGRITNPRVRDLLTAVDPQSGKSLLAKHLDRFTHRNTSDYFVHKNLRNFLRRELDFYIKDQVLSLDELLAESTGASQLGRARANVVREVALQIIDFLAQLEDFKRALFEKKKFVVDTQYVLSLKTLQGLVDKDVFKAYVDAARRQMAANDHYWNDIVLTLKQTYKQPGNNVYADQVTRGEDSVEISYAMRFIDEGEFEEYLKNHKGQKHWKEKGTLRGKTDQDIWYVGCPPGRLPTQVNYSELYLDTAYFDGDFKLSLLDALSKRHDLDEIIDGVLIRGENWQALNLLQETYRGRVKCLYADPPYNTGSDGFLYKDNYQHSSWLAMLFDRLSAARELLTDDGSIYVSIDWNESHSLKRLLDIVFGRDEFQREIIWNTGENISGFKSIAPNWIRQHDTIYFYTRNQDKLQFTKAWVPIDEKARRANYAWKDILGPDKEHLYTEVWGKGKLQSHAVTDREVKAIGDVWNDILSFQYSEPRVTESWFFPTQKVENLLRRIIQSATRPSELVLDCFLGSGTTAAVAQKLGRKWIGIEIGDYLEDIALVRMKTVLIGDTRTHLSQEVGWQGGGFLKYQTLEQFEDTLDNLELVRSREGQIAHERFGDDYLIRYMLEFETRGSAPWLGFDHLENPFEYRMVFRDRSGAKERTVDLPETFNYLLGLRIDGIRVFADGSRKYLAVLGRKGGRRVAAIWRSLEKIGEDPDALRADKHFIEKTVFPGLGGVEGFERIFVNGLCLAERAEQVEPEFKRLMQGFEPGS